VDVTVIRAPERFEDDFLRTMMRSSRRSVFAIIGCAIAVVWVTASSTAQAPAAPTLDARTSDPGDDGLDGRRSATSGQAHSLSDDSWFRLPQTRWSFSTSGS
jgi:hypothetical protein